jgi:nucleotide-binding universal stress UspA family protein
MFSKIVLATDGSNHANNALDVASDLANKYDAELILVHVLTHDHPSEELARMVDIEYPDVYPGQDDYSSEFFRDSDSPSERNMQRSGDKEARVISVIGEQIMADAKRKASKAGVKNISTAIQSGDYANAILKVSGAKNADIIVMGRRGLSTLKGFLTGSVSNKVAQRAKCSVLTVK